MNTNANEQEWTLDYKPNLVSCEKIPKLLFQILKKSLSL